MKPTIREQLGAILQLLKEIQKYFSTLKEEKSGLRRIAVPVKDALANLLIDDMVYFEADGDYTHLHMADGSRHTICALLKSCEQELRGEHFLRVHDCFLVNLNQVVKYVRGKGGYVEMTGGKTVNVSCKKKHKLLAALRRFGERKEGEMGKK